MSDAARTGRDAPVFLDQFGIRVTPMTASAVAACTLEAVRSGRRIVIGNHNLHSVYLALTDESFRSACARFDYSLIDGFPVLVMAGAVRRKWLGVRRRVGSMDWVPRLIRSGRLTRIAVVGASADSNARATERIRRMAPRAEVLGMPGEGWNDVTSMRVASSLCAFEPEFVLVGLGMPLQEQFLHDSLPLLPRAVYVTVGGAIDQIAGVQRTAPRWLGPLGLEWVWRLLTQPRRLAHRYLVEPFLLVHLLMRQSRVGGAPAPDRVPSERLM